jgi:hypothetical protein
MGAGSMIGIAVFLALVAAAAGVAFWNERRSPGWQAPRERQEPRFPACPSQKLNLGADHADLVPSRGRGRADSMAG